MSEVPKFFTLNDRPVKVIEHAGGWDAMVLDMSSGDWERDDTYLDRYHRRDGDIDLVTEAEFNALVAAIRERLDT